MKQPSRWSAWSQRLQERLQEPLPGEAAQRLMSPRPRFGRHADRDPARGRPAAVMALLYPGVLDSAVHASTGPPCHLVLTRRQPHLSQHSGQVCFPGGAVDPDESPLSAALREVEEEIGIPRQEIQVLGQLTPVFVLVSGYTVQPYVGWLEASPRLIVATDEVAEALQPTLAELLAPDIIRERTQPYRGEQILVPYYDLGPAEVWGATAMMLSELLEVVRTLPPA